MAHSSVNSQRGAVLIHVAIGILILIGVLTWVVDYGVMWVGRRQAQNAADSGALAGAVSMAFDPNGWTNRTDTGPARQAARAMAVSNGVWGESPDVNIATDVFFTDQPADRCVPDADGNTPCIRVNVYRNQERGNPLPALFGLTIGLANQGVRATATARVAIANASDCLKPWAIPDKWRDWYDDTPTVDVDTWTTDDHFDKEACKGNQCVPIQPPAQPDEYIPPDFSTTPSSPGTGYTVAADLGLRLTLKESRPQDSIAPGFFFPVRIPRYDGESKGGDDYRENIATCNGVPIEIGSWIPSENGNMIGPTRQGVEDLIALDPYADWDEASKSVINSCAQATPTPCAAHSPRIVSIPIFDTAVYYAGKLNGNVDLQVVNILGFFIDQMQGNDVVGYLTEAPGLVTGNSSIAPSASFLSQIQLVR